MRRMHAPAYENREPATTRWVRAAGADIARVGEAHPATHENGGAASAVGSASGSRLRSLSVFVARHNLSGSLTIAYCGCDADTDSDPDGPLS
jgi:hypothetical protein